MSSSLLHGERTLSKDIMKTLLTYGDSNTWGLIPGSAPHRRFPLESRWTGILQSLTDDVRIVEEGLCGRTTVFEDAIRPGRNGLRSLPLILESNSPIDALVLMLGTNDCKALYGASSHIIGRGIELCLDEITKYVDPAKILLVSPIHLGDEVWLPEKDPEFNTTSIEISKELKDVYGRIASKRGIAFLAASDIAVASKVDDEHLDEAGHLLLAKAIHSKLIEAGII